jgi:hypothetical protein
MTYPPFNLMPMPDPNSIRMGPLAPPKGPVKAGLLDQILGRIMPSANTGGLLNEDDIKNARQQGLLGLGASLLANSGPKTAAERVGLMQSVGQGIQGAQGAYQGALQGAAGQRMAEQQFKTGDLQQQIAGADLAGKTAALQKAQQLATARQQIVQANPMPKDVNGMAQWIDATLPSFVQIGDEETVARLSEIRKSIGDSKNAQTPQEIRLGDKVLLRDQRTGATVGEYAMGPTPRDPNVGAATREAAQQQRLFSREAQLATAYDKATTGQREAHDFVANTLQNVPAAKAGDGAAQVEMLYAFIKALDPQSVVREGEVSLAREGTGMWDWAKANVEKVENKSAIVPPAMIEQMAKLMEKRLGAYERYINKKRNYYTQRAERAGIPDPDVVFMGIDPYQPAGAPAPAGQTYTLPDGTVIK